MSEQMITERQQYWLITSAQRTLSRAAWSSTSTVEGELELDPFSADRYRAGAGAGHSTYPENLPLAQRIRSNSRTSQFISQYLVM